MEQEIEKLKKEVLDFKVKDSNELLLFRQKFVGKKGVLNKLFLDFKIS